MVMKIKIKWVLLTLSILICGIFAVKQFISHDSKFFAGGSLYAIPCTMEIKELDHKEQKNEIFERFQRPSKEMPLENKYQFGDFENHKGTKFRSPDDVVFAYYGILKDASNMLGYTGGCGTIGDANLPYSYAYQLLTDESRKRISFSQFMDSFRGIGHITFLKIYPVFLPPGTPNDTKYYMVEIEVISGKPEAFTKVPISSFDYYYGIVTVKNEGDSGWKIQSVDYLPEDFLCAPFHGWQYDSEALVQIVYGNNLNLIKNIDEVKKEGNLIRIFASGGVEKYRFDFVRLTNGHDILLHEYKKVDGKWNEVDLLTDVWNGLKFDIHIFK